MKNGKPKIEKGIPVPLTNRRVRTEEGPLMKTMEVGDSILVHKSHSSTANLAQHHLGAGNYTTRKEGDGIRVWRTK